MKQHKKIRRPEHRFGEVQRVANQASDYEEQEDFEELHAVCGPPAPVEFKSKPPSSQNIKMMQGFVPERNGRALETKQSIIDQALSKAKLNSDKALQDEFKSPRDQQYARRIKQAVAKK